MAVIRLCLSVPLLLPGALFALLAFALLWLGLKVAGRRLSILEGVTGAAARNPGTVAGVGGDGEHSALRPRRRE